MSSANYKERDTKRLLEMVAKVLPSGSNEWEQVTVFYNTNRPGNIPQRDQESLKRKFKGMVNSKKPTGDPTIPPTILEAKQIQKSINVKVSQLTDELDFDDLEKHLIHPSKQLQQNDNVTSASNTDAVLTSSSNSSSINSVENIDQTLPVQRLGNIPTSISYTAQKKRKLDAAIESISSDSSLNETSSNWFEKFILMQSTQEAKYRAEEKQFKLEQIVKEEARYEAQQIREEKRLAEQEAREEQNVLNFV
ncbi:hypothetical protein BC833DRAFT_624690 [Globomyces pollinis-pini]|nr:hypothetical protein BC833DRAFT_624690 [Globomyces pollinis-pini]